MLTIHRATRTDRLVRGLARLLAAPPADPFAPEVVAVPSRGVERWISQQLSLGLGARTGGADGVCANVLFPSPGRLVADALARAGGLAPEDDPWSESRLPWSVLEVVDEVAPLPGFETLGRYLGASGPSGPRDGDKHRRSRRMAVALKLARLFGSYAAQRPAMLRDWVDGHDTDGSAEGRSDGDVHGAVLESRPLDDDLRWQAELWRRVRVRIGLPSPAERLGPACAALRSHPGLVDLPDRVSLFGPTRLTTDQLRVLDALALRREVHLWLPHPSPRLWTRLTGEPPGVRRRDDRSVAVPLHPLLASLGRDVRELQLRLAEHVMVARDVDEDVDEDESLPTWPPHGVSAPSQSLLARLQDDIRADRAPDRGHVMAAHDRSVQVHACHGRQRQVEVLREVVLGLLEDDPTLEPRDMVVMCPDVEAFAPLVGAAFGLAPDEDVQAAEDDRVHPAHRLRVRLADRSVRQTNPVLTVLARLLELADARLTATEVLDLAAMPPVRRRFGLDEEDLERVADWVRRSGVRWGLDAAARAPYRLDGVRQNTWEAGLDRLLVGVVMEEEGLRTVGLALPLDDVDSGEIELAGRVAELVDRLGTALTRLRQEQSVMSWVQVLGDALDDLVDVGPFDAWQVTSARAQLAAVETSAGTTSLLRLGDVRALVARRLEGRPTRASFRTGHLTVCSMVPMRSVPHRVVLLLGLDDQVFPRSVRLDGDDVLSRDPRVGEREGRSEDRQLLLDAILAAREQLVMLYSGRDERSGARRPPAVPLGELLDVLDATAEAPSRGTVRTAVLVDHPLQPFDPASFQAGRLVPGRPFGFDRAACAGGRALVGERHPPAPFLTGPLPPPAETDTVALADLVSFLQHPVRAFLRQRLDLSSPGEEDEPEDALVTELDGLEQWQVGQRALGHRLTGLDLAAVERGEWLRGQLPPGALGAGVLRSLLPVVETLVASTEPLRVGPPQQIDVRAHLAEGPVVVGVVSPIHGDAVLEVSFSRVSARDRIRAWTRLLALTVARPDRPWRTLTVGKGPGGSATVHHLGPLDVLVAQAELLSLLDIYRAGMREPLPLPVRTAAAYARRRSAGGSPHDAELAAASEWSRDLRGTEIGEIKDASHQRVWGAAPFSALTRQPPVPGERSSADWTEEPHRFGGLACRVWAPVIAAEQRR